MTDAVSTLFAIMRTSLQAFVLKVFEILHPGDEFLPNWHVEAINYHLQQCVDGHVRRLIIVLPPRSLKSLCASIAFPIWILGRDPTRHVMCISYGEILARDFALKRRQILEDPFLQKIFPTLRIRKDKNTEQEIKTTMGGSIYTTSIDGAFTGRGANVIIIDDPSKAGDVMSQAERDRVNTRFQNAIYSRLNSKKDGVIIIVMQRIHFDDLVGHVLQLDDWTVLTLPAIATEKKAIQIGDDRYHHREIGHELHPHREGHETLAKIKRAIGTRNFEAQYQQNPLPPDGEIFKKDWLQHYKGNLAPSDFEEIVQSWDTASSLDPAASYSVGTTWGICKKGYYLLDVVRVRAQHPELLRLVRRKARVFGANAILIEDAGIGRAILQTLSHEGGFNLIPIRPKLDKQTRAEQQSATMEAGRVFLPEEAHWQEEFERELLLFPSGPHDDQVDSVTQFLGWITLRGRRLPEIRVHFVGSRSEIRDLYQERTGISMFRH